MKDSMVLEETFTDTMKRYLISQKRYGIETLQLNLTKKCNQTCSHCHMDAGPARTEVMSVNTITRILYLLDKSNTIKTVDITGGAPELNKNFRYLVSELRKRKKQIIDRCNLTVLLEAGQEDTARFLSDNEVTIIASLPCYLEENVDSQRGHSIYQKSIKALKHLNSLGYGVAGSGLVLNLVYNPGGAYLPGDQAELEVEYKQVLSEKHEIVFNHLLTITNMPINRYARLLKEEGSYEDYSQLLVSNFNPAAADKIMCKSQISVGWNGMIYDCDFNQALGIPILSEKKSVMEIDDFSELSRLIAYQKHCFGCTAGCGSSCQGSLT